jgi:hypothetical protein
MNVENNTDNSDYIAAISEIKANSVSKEAYDKLKDEKKKLLDALVNGKEIEKKEDAPNIQELRDRLFDGTQKSNLEYVETALKLRKSLIEKGERDPFLPFGDKVTLTDSIYNDAENVAAVLQECVDFAEGDSSVFTAKLQSKLADVNLPKRKF